MRKPFIDNLRCGVVLLVIAYHIVYLFNSVGVISNVGITGTPEADVLLYICYPWFMALLFLLAGISARYALEKTDTRTWLKGRVRKILLPSLAGVFLVGWVSGLVTFWYNPAMFGGAEELLPGIVKYLILCFAGIGPLWFLQVLFFCTLVLVLLRRMERGDRFWKLCGRWNRLWMLCLLFFPVWLSSYLLNLPVIEGYRPGFYLTFFLTGYYVFSHEEAQKTAQRFRLPLLAAAVLFGIGYTVSFWGQNYAALSCLQTPSANAFAWFGCLALLGCGRKWWNRETGFTRYMRGRSFGFYVLHYPLMVLITCVMDMKFELTFPLFYAILAVCTAALLPLCCAVLSRVWMIRSCLFGIARG